MSEDIIRYLSKQKGVNLDQMMPGIFPVNEQYRFDSNKFDILTYSFEHESFYGIKLVKPGSSLSFFQKISMDTAWISQFDGRVLLLIPADYRAYDRTIFDTVCASLIQEKYYAPCVGGFTFMDNPEARNAVITRKGSDIAAKVFTNPQVINYVFRKVAGKSEIGKLVKLAYNVGTKLLK